MNKQHHLCSFLSLSCLLSANNPNRSLFETIKYIYFRCLPLSSQYSKSLPDGRGSEHPHQSSDRIGLNYSQRKNKLLYYTILQVLYTYPKSLNPHKPYEMACYTVAGYTIIIQKTTPTAQTHTSKHTPSPPNTLRVNRGSTAVPVGAR